ncbi:hypothetical protein ACOSP6_12115 [Tenacibaculum sp. MEBiC06402]|uniref:hypothetical protein n=1 Tax=unclassified Tenacibaculum TaxID=2635139 RepID=UPI003B9DC38E
MYKHTKNTRDKIVKGKKSWLKRKLLYIITAFMLGMSNAMYDESKMITGNQDYIEQKQKKE